MSTNEPSSVPGVSDQEMVDRVVESALTRIRAAVAPGTTPTGLVDQLAAAVAPGRWPSSQRLAVPTGLEAAPWVGRSPSAPGVGLDSSVRPSLAFYDMHAEIDALVDAVRRSCAS